VKREDKESPAVALSRAQFDALAIPVWSGQISQRAGFLGSLAAGASAGESDDRLQDRDRAAMVRRRAFGGRDQSRACRRRKLPGGAAPALAATGTSGCSRLGKARKKVSS
jgi:hypothetical protein